MVIKEDIVREQFNEFRIKVERLEQINRELNSLKGPEYFEKEVESIKKIIHDVSQLSKIERKFKELKDKIKAEAVLNQKKLDVSQVVCKNNSFVSKKLREEIKRSHEEISNLEDNEEKLKREIEKCRIEENNLKIKEQLKLEEKDKLLKTETKKLKLEEDNLKSRQRVKIQNKNNLLREEEKKFEIEENNLRLKQRLKLNLLREDLRKNISLKAELREKLSLANQKLARLEEKERKIKQALIRTEASKERLKARDRIKIKEKDKLLKTETKKLKLEEENLKQKQKLKLKNKDKLLREETKKLKLEEDNIRLKHRLKESISKKILKKAILAKERFKERFKRSNLIKLKLKKDLEVIEERLNGAIEQENKLSQTFEKLNTSPKIKKLESIKEDQKPLIKEKVEQVKITKEIKEEPLIVPLPGKDEASLREKEWKKEIDYLINYKKSSRVLFEEILENLPKISSRKVSDEKYLMEFAKKEPRKYEKFKEAVKILGSCYEKFKFLFSLVYPHVSNEKKKELDDFSKEWNSELQRKLENSKNILEKQLVYLGLFDRYILKFSLTVFHSID